MAYFPLTCILFLFVFVLPVFSHLKHPHLRPNGLRDSNTRPSPFGFIKSIQGCHKGDHLKGIHDLKLYLSHFGYLYYQNNPNVTDPKEDDFDEDLEVAIKSYQEYYHLNSTGTLDAPTVSMMIKPRCGVPDKQTHQRSDKSLHTVSHYSFFPGRPKWPRGKRNLTVAFGPGFPTRFVYPVAQAFSKWQIASRYFRFSNARTYESADIKISFERGDHDDGFPFDGPGGVLAHAFAPPDGLLHFDADTNWGVGAVPNVSDIETVALHEIGHLLGLDHSQHEDALMWPTLNRGVTKGLNSDDIRGVRALYGR